MTKNFQSLGNNLQDFKEFSLVATESSDCFLFGKAVAFFHFRFIQSSTLLLNSTQLNPLCLLHLFAVQTIPLHSTQLCFTSLYSALFMSTCYVPTYSTSLSHADMLAKLSLLEDYINAMWGSIQQIMPMTRFVPSEEGEVEKPHLRSYRMEIIERLKSWERLMHDAENEHAQIKASMNKKKI